jgi:hypothetical protein
MSEDDIDPSARLMAAMAERGCSALGLSEEWHREYMILLLMHAFREGMHRARRKAPQVAP